MAPRTKMTPSEVETERKERLEKDNNLRAEAPKEKVRKGNNRNIELVTPTPEFNEIWPPKEDDEQEKEA